MEVEENQDSEVATQNADHRSSNPQDEKEKLELLEFEKREAIGEILKLNPNYKTPPDYKPLLKEAIVPIPVKEYPGYNFLGLIFGPASDTQKRLEKETGATIQVYGTKAHTGEKIEISPSDGNVHGTYEELYIHISADTYEKVDAAADLIELLVTSVSENLAALSKSTSASGENVNVLSQSQDEVTRYVVPAAVEIQGGLQPVIGPMQTPPQVQFQYQSPWLQAGLPQTSMRHVNASAPILVNPANMPSLFGPRPATAAGFTSVLQNQSLVPPSSQLPMQVPPRPYMPQIHPLGHIGPPRNFPMSAPQHSSAQHNISIPLPFTGSQLQATGPHPIGRPLIPSLSQAVSNIPLRPPPDRPLAPAGSSTGWSGASASAQTMVPPQGPQPGGSQPIVASSAPPPTISAAGNMVSLASFPSGPSTAQPTNTALNRSAGSVFASGPPPQVRSSPTFPGLHLTQIPASTPTGVQPSPPIPVAASSVPSIAPASLQAGISNSVSRSTSFSTINPPSATASRPQHPSSGDFTFQPHRPQNLTVPRPSNQLPMLNTPPPRPMAQLQAPQAPSFQLGGPNVAPQSVMQVFPRPQVGNQMGQSQAQIPVVTFARNSNAAFANASPVAPTTPVSQMGPRNFGPGHQVPNFAGPFPLRPGNPLQLQQNYPAPRNRPENLMGLNQQYSNNRSFSSDKLAPSAGGPQIYDPFSPTAVLIRPQQQAANPARTRKQDNDPEYEDLMASVGVK